MKQIKILSLIAFAVCNFLVCGKTLGFKNFDEIKNVSCFEKLKKLESFETENCSFELTQRCDLNQLSYIILESMSPNFKNSAFCSVPVDGIQNRFDALNYLTKNFENTTNILNYSVRSNKIMTYPLIGQVVVNFSNYLASDGFVKKKALVQLFLETHNLVDVNIIDFVKEIMCAVTKVLLKFKNVGAVFFRAPSNGGLSEQNFRLTLT